MTTVSFDFVIEKFACQPLRLVHATNKLSDSLCTSSGLCLMNSFGQTSFRRVMELSTWWCSGSLSRPLIPPVGCSDQTRITFRVWPVPFGWARQSSRYLCPVAVVSNLPRGFASWFLPLPCLLENASCKKAHHYRLPFLQSV
ncbi:uncharacterized protein LOC142795289 isoform X2 [Rhipicephalus microplus]|uniref:uncharacterized protein LOC142767242 isoform X2 n=1 Tax=Rhipicephalus microplus TaxID=6941 RepID=UPI003F6D423A